MAELIASEEEVVAFNGLADNEKRVTGALRGVLAETATTGIIRYEWDVLKPLVWHLLNQVLIEFEAESRVEVGPSVPLGAAESLSDLQRRFRRLLDSSPGAPFTLQRMCELVLQPRKQYTRIDKLAVAVDKLLTVTTAVRPTPNPPPRPALADLRPVNDNPPPVPGQQAPDANGDMAGPSGNLMGLPNGTAMFGHGMEEEEAGAGAAGPGSMQQQQQHQYTGGPVYGADQHYPQQQQQQQYHQQQQQGKECSEAGQVHAGANGHDGGMGEQTFESAAQHGPCNGPQPEQAGPEPMDTDGPAPAMEGGAGEAASAGTEAASASGAAASGGQEGPDMAGPGVAEGAAAAGDADMAPGAAAAEGGALGEGGTGEGAAEAALLQGAPVGDVEHGNGRGAQEDRGEEQASSAKKARSEGPAAGQEQQQQRPGSDVAAGEYLANLP